MRNPIAALEAMPPIVVETETSPIVLKTQHAKLSVGALLEGVQIPIRGEGHETHKATLQPDAADAFALQIVRAAEVVRACRNAVKMGHPNPMAGLVKP